MRLQSTEWWWAQQWSLWSGISNDYLKDPGPKKQIRWDHRMLHRILLQRRLEKGSGPAGCWPAGWRSVCFALAVRASGVTAWWKCQMVILGFNHITAVYPPISTTALSGFLKLVFLKWFSFRLVSNSSVPLSPLRADDYCLNRHCTNTSMSDNQLKLQTWWALSYCSLGFWVGKIFRLLFSA